MKVVKYLCVLIVIAVIGTLGLTSLPQKVPHKSWILTLTPSVLHSHFLNNLIQQNYTIPSKDDLDTDKDDFTVEGLKKFFGFFSIANLKFLTSSALNPNWESLNSIDSSPYNITFFASLPLRSPPLFS